MKLRVPRYSISFFIMVLYLVMGSLIILKYSVGQEEPDMRLALFGAVVIIYGIYRGYRAYKDYQTEKEEQNETE